MCLQRLKFSLFWCVVYLLIYILISIYLFVLVSIGCTGEYCIVFLSIKTVGVCLYSGAFALGSFLFVFSVSSSLCRAGFCVFSTFDPSSVY